MKKAETQEQEFLEVCSSYDHDLLTGKKEMTLKDYERITYLVSSLGYSQYLQFLIGKYMDLLQVENIAAETAESIVAVCYNQSRCKCLKDIRSEIQHENTLCYRPAWR